MTSKRFGIGGAAALVLSVAVCGTARADLASLREQCQQALSRGDQPVARELCKRAFIASKAPEDIRNNVAALMEGPTAPTMGELVEAVYKTDLAIKLAPNEPWGYAARGIIALRIDDPALLQGALADLRRVAPDHEQTRALVARARGLDPLPATLGRWLLLLALLGTGALALRRSRRARRARLSSTTPALLLGVCTFLLLGAAPRALQAAPAQLSEIQIDDANPAASVPDPEAQMKNPIQFGYFLQDLLADGTAATKSGDLEAAARYYSALAKAVPSRAFAFGKLCETLQASGEPDKALSFCREAATREGVTLDDYGRLVDLIIAKEAPTAAEREELATIAKHVGAQKEASIGGELIRCKVAVALHDVRTLESCTAALAAAAATDSTTISYQWALAVERHDFAGARGARERARKAGVDQEALAKMDATIAAAHRQWVIRTGLWVLGAGLVVVLLVRARARFV